MGKLKIFPTQAECEARAREGANLLAVQAEMSLDMDTPISVYWKLAQRGDSFILESADTTQRQFGRYSFIGTEPLVKVRIFPRRLEIHADNTQRQILGNPVQTMQEFLQAIVVPQKNPLPTPLASGGLVGYWNYEFAAALDRIRGFELAADELLGEFLLCRRLVVFDALRNTGHLLCFMDIRKETVAAAYAKARKTIAEMQAQLLAPRLPIPLPKERPVPLHFLSQVQNAPQDFLQDVQTIQEHILAGDIFQAVPSRPFTAEVHTPAFLFYRRLRQVNPSPYMFYLHIGQTELVGASPEMLVKVEAGGKIITYPIAGTRRRGQDAQEDARLAAELTADEKECAEHSMLVDLARNDIGRVCQAGTVQVTKLRQVEKFSHVLHMVSEVQGKLRADINPMQVLQATFPAGTVSGAPKLRAMEILHRLEKTPRKAYAGTVGYLDFRGQMDMCITLRTLRIENGRQATIQAGAGIVADSVPAKEYQEILQKAKALFEVVEEVENGVITFG